MSRNIEFTGPFKNKISFDTSKIRQKICNPTFRQARRYADIYNALIQEFYENGCLTSAKYFQTLVEKECTLYKKASIRDRISDEQKLLLGLFDSCMAAEKAALSEHCNGSETCAQLLLQCILMLENYAHKYDWILIDVFRIAIKIAAKVCQAEEVSKNPLCQIYYKFGMYLKKSDLAEAVKYLEKSFYLSRGTNWVYMEENKPLNISSLAATSYASILLCYANDIVSCSPENAITQAQKALVVLTAEGIERNENIYIKANLDMAAFQLKAGNYNECHSLLENIVKYIRNILHENKAHLHFLSCYNHLKGVCFKCEKKYDGALVELYKSLNIKRHLNMKHEEGVVLMDIAKTYLKRGHSQYRMAESCLRQSKKIFIDLNDTLNTKKTSYLMAHLMMQNIQPMVFDLIKSIPFNYCDRYRLIRWKSLCLPFWRNLHGSLYCEENNSLDCILKGSESGD